MLPILFTLLGMYRAPKLEHPLNVQLGISFMPLPIFIVCKDTQSLKIPAPILSTFFGILIEYKEIQLSNAKAPISSMSSGMEILLRDLQP